MSRLGGTRLATLGLLAAALVGLWQASRLESWGFDGPGAGFFPQLVAGLCVALVGFALTLLNSGFDEITNPRLVLERVWRTHLVRHGARPTRSTPVVRDR